MKKLGPPVNRCKFRTLYRYTKEILQLIMRDLMLEKLENDGLVGLITALRLGGQFYSLNWVPWETLFLKNPF